MGDERPDVLPTGLLFYDLARTGLGQPPTAGEEIWTVLFAASLQWMFPDEGDDPLSWQGFLPAAGTALPTTPGSRETQALFVCKNSGGWTGNADHNAARNILHLYRMGHALTSTTSTGPPDPASAPPTGSTTPAPAIRAARPTGAPARSRR